MTRRLQLGFSRIFFVLSGSAIAVLLLAYPISNVLGQTTTHTYYVDCNGLDSNTGTSESSAWRTVSKANSIDLNPGDRLLFKRGCTWVSSENGNYLIFDHVDSGLVTNPIIVGAYGTGNKPVIRTDARGNTSTPSTHQNNIVIRGNHLIIENLKTDTINHNRDSTCLQNDGSAAKLGWYSGFNVEGDFNTLRNIESNDQSLGVFLQDSSNNNKVFNAYVHDMSTFWRIYHAGAALGSIGVNLHGLENEVANSLFERNKANCTDSTGRVHNYSAPFEVYNANKAYVHHNKAYGHRKHFEMGKDTTFVSSADNVLAYNLFVSDQPNAVGPNIHSSGNQFGPIERTQVYNNTVVLTGANSQAIVGSGGGTFKNNIFVAEWKAAYYGSGTTESNNIYWDYQRTLDNSPDPCIQFPSSGCSSLATLTSDVNPGFVNPIVSGLGDFHLLSSSAALDRGVSVSTSIDLLRNILSSDLDGRPVPQNLAVDIGSYEFGTIAITPSSTPTPIPVPSVTITPSPTSLIPRPGDANGDQIVDETDYSIWLVHYGQSTASGSTDGDFNSDGQINGLDFAVWRANFTI